MNQNRIFGNGAKWAGGQVGRWAGGSHAVNGDNDVAKMHNEKNIYKKYAGACVCRKKAVILQREITL